MSALDGSVGNVDFLPAAIEEPVEQSGSMLRDAWRRIAKSPTSMISLNIVVIYLIVGLLGVAGLFDSRINESYSVDQTYAPPSLYRIGPDGSKTISPGCWFGLDIEGRSIFWRVLYGTRIALLIIAGTTAIVLFIGTILGLVGGYFGGWIDVFIVWLFSTVSSIPWLLLVIAIAYIIQNRQVDEAANTSHKIRDFFGGSTTVILSLGLTDWVGLCRLIRGEVLRLRELDFVVAGRAIGLGNWRIIFRHILPNTFHLIIISFSLSAIAYAQAEVVLAFLGLGINATKPSWGRMIDDSKLEVLRGNWWEATAATVAIFILCLALSILGDALRDALDPRLRGVK